VYHRFREELIARGGEAVTLVRNFRSRPDLIASINGLFGHVLSGGEDFQPAYSPVLPSREDAGESSPMTLFSLGEEVPEPEFLCGLRAHREDCRKHCREGKIRSPGTRGYVS
jgi:ATP-dependent exoDNAse (exonuclease V) beta subunit